MAKAGSFGIDQGTPTVDRCEQRIAIGAVMQYLWPIESGGGCTFDQNVSPLRIVRIIGQSKRRCESGRAKRQVTLRIRRNRVERDAERVGREGSRPVRLERGEILVGIQPVTETYQTQPELTFVECLPTTNRNRPQRASDARAAHDRAASGRLRGHGREIVGGLCVKRIE